MAGAPSIGRLVLIATLVASAPGVSSGQIAGDIAVVRFESVYGGQPGPASPYPITRLDDGEQGTELDRIRAGAVTFSQPLPIRDVLLLMFRGTPFSIVVDPSVNGTFIGELGDLSLRQALEAVLAPSGLDYRRQGRVIQVSPPRTETRLFEVSYLDVQRSSRHAAAGGSATPESDFFSELTAGVQSLLSPGGRAHVDRKAGVVQVTDFADRLQQIDIYIETVLLRATRQVQLTTRVLEVTLTDRPAIDWAAVAKAAGVTPGAGGGIVVGDFDALLRAIGGFGTVRTIAVPRLVAMNNEPAVMRIGPDGLTLSITSQISADGLVHMNVSPKIATGARPGPSASTGTVIEVDTAVRVRGGDTVVIAGLIREEPETATGSSHGTDGGKDRRTSRTELVVLLTPTVVSVSAGSVPAAGAQ